MSAEIVVADYLVNFIKPLKKTFSPVNSLSSFSYSSKTMVKFNSFLMAFSNSKLMTQGFGNRNDKALMLLLDSKLKKINFHFNGETKFNAAKRFMRYTINGIAMPLQFMSITRVAFSPEKMNLVVVPLGSNSISGVVHEGKTPVSRKVRLYRKDNGVFVAETKSDELGNYLFDGLPAGMAFFVVSHDSSGSYNAAVTDNIIS